MLCKEENLQLCRPHTAVVTSAKGTYQLSVRVPSPHLAGQLALFASSDQTVWGVEVWMLAQSGTASSPWARGWRDEAAPGSQQRTVKVHL